MWAQKIRLLTKRNISSPNFGQHKFCISQWAENKDLRRRDHIIPNRRIFPSGNFLGPVSSRQDRVEVSRGYIRIPGWNLTGLPQHIRSPFAGKIKITPRFWRAAPANTTQRMARSRHLAWIKNARRTRFRLKFASYAYTTPSKECDVKSDTRLCPAYSLIARRRIVANAGTLSGEECPLSDTGKTETSTGWPIAKICRKKRLRGRTVFWILTRKILLKIPIVLKYNFRRIRERAVALRYPPIFTGHAMVKS